MSPRATTRRAFTLMEVMLTLCLLVAIVGLAWPALDKPFANQRLRKAADQIRAAWGQARVEAMDTGETYIFRYEPQGNGYRVERSTAAEMAAADLTSGGSSTRAAAGQSVAAGSNKKLPQQVTFVGSETVADTRSAMLDSESTSTSFGTAATGGCDTIFFHPDGTASTARLVLKNEHGYAVELTLRGLTGVAYVGEMQTAEEFSP